MVVGPADHAQPGDGQAAGGGASGRWPGNAERGLLLLLDLLRAEHSGRAAQAAGEVVRGLAGEEIRLAGGSAGQMERAEGKARRSGGGPDWVPATVEYVQREDGAGPGYGSVPPGSANAILLGDLCLSAEAGLQGADYSVELGHRQPASLRAVGEAELHLRGFY